MSSSQERSEGIKIPGYTGFMPYKNDIVGLTTGKANLVSKEAFDNEHGRGVLNKTGSQVMGSME